jgi:hypothetical protein
MHFLAIILIIVIIVFFQFKIFWNTTRKLKVFKDIFAPKSDAYNLQKTKIITAIQEGKWTEHNSMMNRFGLDMSKFTYSQLDDEGNTHEFYHIDQVKDLLIAKVQEGENGIVSNYDNPVYKVIQTSINTYLAANKSGVSDFHLMKDIVDRNCDTQEEEINTQIPIPLYLGLVGTMVGILVGIGNLWVSGGLNDLLNGGNGSSGAEGVESLLGGVALAMISSIFGILLTTFGSMIAKNAKVKVEKNKHVFLSWIQAKLLPNLSNDTAATLEKMSQNLVAFNNTFSSNTNELGKALSQVNESYRLQTLLLKEVKQIADKDISVKNFQLYNVLKNSTDEIGTLATYLNNVNDYLANVRALNEKLDASEQRTRSIEEMAVFFKTEVLQIEARKGMINKAVGTVDDVLQEALGKLKDHANDQLEELKKTTGKQYDFLQKNSEQIHALVSELKNLSAVKDSISKFEQAARSQNSKLDNLVTAIQALAKAKAEGTTMPRLFEPQMPFNKKIIIWSSSFGGSLVVLFLVIANWDAISGLLDNIISLFRF